MIGEGDGIDPVSMMMMMVIVIIIIIIAPGRDRVKQALFVFLLFF